MNGLLKKIITILLVITMLAAVPAASYIRLLCSYAYLRLNY